MTSTGSRHIGDLTAAGVNIEGVRRILELEQALDATRAELEQTRVAATEAVERTHRQYRRELVPYASGVWRSSGDGSAGPSFLGDSAGGLNR